MQQVGCGADGAGEIGSSSDALLSAATKNFAVSGVYDNVRETSVAYQPGCNNGKGGWAVGFNAPCGIPNTVAGVSSSDPAGTSWNASIIPSGTAWGKPGANAV